MACFSENSKKVYAFVKENEAKNVTAMDVAAALDLDVKQVNGIVTSSFQRKGFMERVPAEIELEDGTHKSVKFIHLTEAGRTMDINMTWETKTGK